MTIKRAKFAGVIVACLTMALVPICSASALTGVRHPNIVWQLPGHWGDTRHQNTQDPPGGVIDTSEHHFEILSRNGIQYSFRKLHFHAWGDARATISGSARECSSGSCTHWRSVRIVLRGIQSITCGGRARFYGYAKYRAHPLAGDSGRWHPSSPLNC